VPFFQTKVKFEGFKPVTKSGEAPPTQTAFPLAMVRFSSKTSVPKLNVCEERKIAESIFYIWH
jgi:hypothetical protein